jgi:hypothetical protein
MNRVLLLVLVSALVCAGPGPARAELVTISLGQTIFNPDADILILAPRAFNLELTPDVPSTALMQLGALTVRGSFLDFATFPGTLSRTVTANGSTGTLSQPVTLSITPTLDTLTILPGPTTVLSLGGPRRLEITPLGTTVFGDEERAFPVNVEGTFRLFLVPEPSALVLAGVGLLGLPGFRWQRRS